MGLEWAVFVHAEDAVGGVFGDAGAALGVAGDRDGDMSKRKGT